MIEFTHATTRYKCKPENAPGIHDLLAIIDKSKGKRGAKFERPKGLDKHHSAKRDYPKFNPECMLTSDYVTAYTALNHARLHLVSCAFEPATNRTPKGYDPHSPLCVEETIE
jgi:hypothetical protein